jgi:ferredoxin-type protein NapH
MKHDFAKIRRYWQHTVVIAVVIAAWSGLPVTFCAVDLGILKLVCPMGFVECCLSAKTVVTRMLPGFLLSTALIVLLGRAFCAWVCPARIAANAADSLISKPLPGPLEKVRTAVVRLRQRLHNSVELSWGDGVALTAGLLVGIAFFSFPAYSIFCPVGVLSRNLIELSVHIRLRWELIFLVVPLAAGLFFALGWKCACPPGLIRGILAKANRTLQPVVDLEHCKKCGMCVKNCEFGIRLHKGDFDSFACSKCLKCLQDCEQQAVHLKILSRAGKQTLP